MPSPCVNLCVDSKPHQNLRGWCVSFRLPKAEGRLGLVCANPEASTSQFTGAAHSPGRNHRKSDVEFSFISQPQTRKQGFVASAGQVCSSKTANLSHKQESCQRHANASGRQGIATMADTRPGTLARRLHAQNCTQASTQAGAGGVSRSGWKAGAAGVSGRTEKKSDALNPQGGGGLEHGE